MGLIGTLTDLEPGTLADADVVDANLEAIRTVVNTYAVLTDVTRTISAAQTFSAGVTMSSGLTVSSGTTAVQALTCTTLTPSSTSTLQAVTCTTLAASGAATFSTTVAVTTSVTVPLLASSAGLTLTAASGNIIQFKPNNTQVAYFSASGHLLFNSDNTYDIGAAGATRVRYVYAGTALIAGNVAADRMAFGAISATVGSISGTDTGAIVYSADAHRFFSKNAAAERWQISTSGHLLAATDNTYDIGASGATRPRNVYVAGAVTAGGALSCTTITATTVGASGLITASAGVTIPTGQTLTLAGSGTTPIIDCTGSAPRLRVASSGGLKLVANNGTSILTVWDDKDVEVGVGSAINTASNSGFFCLPFMAGVASGTPTRTAAAVWDNTNKKIQVWDGSSWLKTAALT